MKNTVWAMLAEDSGAPELRTPLLTVARGRRTERRAQRKAGSRGNIGARRIVSAGRGLLSRLLGLW